MAVSISHSATSNLAAVDIGQGVSNAWSAVATFVPKLVAFLVILLIGWFVAKMLAKAVSKILGRVGFDRLVERGGMKQMLAKSKFDASDIIAKLVYYAVLLITLQIAFGVWGPNPVSTLLTEIVAWLPRLAVAIIIVVVVAAIARAVKDMLTNALSGLSYGKLIATIASVFIWALGIIAAVNQIGVATTVTMPVLITVLATIGGVLVVGVGGGLISPMRQRWDNWLDRAEQELPAAKAQTDAYQRGREDASRASTETTGPIRTQEAPAGSTAGATPRPSPGPATGSGPAAGPGSGSTSGGGMPGSTPGSPGPMPPSPNR